MTPIQRLRRIEVRGARVHNLRSVDADFDHGRFHVITGLSGSGKSSLAFDTVFAEGRRRYMESLSAYARQFVEQIPRPDVDAIDGLPPTVCIDQRTTRGGRRATVASLAEVLDFVRLLWARLGTRYCHRCEIPVTSHPREWIVDRVRALAKDADAEHLHLFAPLVVRRKGFHKDVFEKLARHGIELARVDGRLESVDPPPELSRYHEHDIDGLVATVDPGDRDELEDAVASALRLGEGTLSVSVAPDGADAQLYSERAACTRCAQAYRPLDPGDLSWSRRHGMCRRCDGTGVEPDREDAACSRCEGSRLSPAARAVRYRGTRMHEFLDLPIRDARLWMDSLVGDDDRERAVLAPIRTEVRARLEFVERVGLGYLQLSRGARTLAGGESQRVRLASQLGTGLRGVCYVLDEPTIGLHPEDNARLLGVLRELTERGATLLVVEHDEATIRAADHVLDLGPGAGVHGGRVVASGTPDELAREPHSVTGPWLSGSRSIEPPRRHLDWTERPALVLEGASARNLKDVTVSFPLGALTCVTGVSGSGKSTLVREVLLPALQRAIGRVGPEPGEHRALHGFEDVNGVLEIDQDPIGKTSRSVPATYTKIMDPLRKLFAASTDAKARGFTASRFSFNSAGGRCEDCSGQGRIRVEMSFLPDVVVPCETCDGARFDEETLAVRFLGRSIAEVLDLPVAEARQVFESFPKIGRVLTVMDEIGLSYLRLGQPSPTLSGGEAQRVKLAAEMAKRGRGNLVYVLDEPTTGLHFEDVEKLVAVLHRLTAMGNTVIVIEHDLDVIAAADVVVDLGPGGGEAGGELVAFGTPEQVAAVPHSATGRHLAAKLARTGDRVADIASD